MFFVFGNQWGWKTENDVALLYTIEEIHSMYSTTHKKNKQPRQDS